MILLANFVIAVGTVLQMLLSTLILIIVIQAIISWVNPDPYNPIVRFLNSVTEPMLRPLRRYLPPIGGRLDFSPFILVLLLYILQLFLVQSILDYGHGMRISALGSVR